MYCAGQCSVCGKLILTKEEHKKQEFVICEILVCVDCCQKAFDLLKQEHSQKNNPIKL